MTTSADNFPPPPKPPQFPPHNAPRVWFLSNGTSPIALALARLALAHGDYIVASVLPSDLLDEVRSQELKAFLEDVGWQGDGNGDGEDEEGTNDDSAASSTKSKGKGWRERVRIVALNGRIVGQCQAAVAEAVEAFGRIDILLCCTSEAVIGTIEELAQSPRTLTLVRDQFETNFFANVNIIKAVLPVMRERTNGHIIMITAVTAHLGTPGLGIYCASQWAIEGYCDSLAYEVAPFNIKMTIVQPNMEISVLTNRITSAPPMPEYSPDANPAPLSREILAGLLDRIDGSASNDSPTPTTTGADHPAHTAGALLTSPAVASLHAPLHPEVKSALIAETVHALAAIGGHDNPPARHIVGFEGVASVKEKLKTVSEELEDFIDVSAAVDFGEAEGLGAGD